MTARLHRTAALSLTALAALAAASTTGCETGDEARVWPGSFGTYTAEELGDPSGIVAASETIEGDAIMRMVEDLSSDRMNGRHWKMVEGFMTAGWVAGQLSALGFEPGAADGTWYDDIAGHEDAAPTVLGYLPGTGDGIVLISAHFDHLKPLPETSDSPDKIFNGADDNASGIAGMLEAGRVLAGMHRADPFVASVYLIGFSGEEAGLRGSRDLVNDPPFDLENVIGLFNCDMISRGEENTICIDGLARSPRIAAAIAKANAHVGLNIKGDEHPEWLPRADQAPFLGAGLEAVLLSVEDHEDYHKVTDHADKVLVNLIVRVSRLMAIAVHDLATAVEVAEDAKDADD